MLRTLSLAAVLTAPSVAAVWSAEPEPSEASDDASTRPEPPPGSFSGLAFGTPVELVLAGRNDAKLVGTESGSSSYLFPYEGDLGSDRVTGEEVLHFRAGVLVGGERRILRRRGKDDRMFFWRAYKVLRADLVAACTAEVAPREEGFIEDINDIPLGAPAVPAAVWDGEFDWFVRCEADGLESEVRLTNPSGAGHKPKVVFKTYLVDAP